MSYTAVCGIVWYYGMRYAVLDAVLQYCGIAVCGIGCGMRYWMRYAVLRYWMQYAVSAVSVVRY